MKGKFDPVERIGHVLFMINTLSCLFTVVQLLHTHINTLINAIASVLISIMLKPGEWEIQEKVNSRKTEKNWDGKILNYNCNCEMAIFCCLQ